MSFLPADYEAPRTTGNYTKFESGETKVRILSSPILGWEEWIDNKPVRYNYKNKPLKWSDSERPGKHFWAMIVWNYNETRIQIMHLHQTSIRKEIESLIKDEDWGSPFSYDIKISKSGEKLRTEYRVNSSPHSTVADHIKESFKERRCYLPALFDGLDPFDCGDDFTKAAFESNGDIKDTAVKTINEAQYQEIIDLIGDDIEYEKELTANLSKVMNIKSLKDLPANRFGSLLKSVKIHSDERIKKEMTSGVPF